MKHIRDSVHGNVFFSEAELAVLDTLEMQRLRRVKQLGFAHLVYPGANHTRFEHSLGVMHLTGMLAEKLGLDASKLRLSGLLHDVGHSAFSHILEPYAERVFDENHEKNTVKKIMKTPLSDVLKKQGYEPREIAECVNHPIISFALGTDRMDYLSRDAHYCGVAYGVIDTPRLLDVIVLEDKLCVLEKGVLAAESMLVARYLMFPTVYNHRVAKIADKMLERGYEFAHREHALSPEKLFEQTDHELVEELLGYEESKPIVQNVLNRRLYKQAGFLEQKPKDEYEYERTLEEKLALPTGTVLIDPPKQTIYEDTEVDVLTNEGYVKLEELSPLTSLLKKSPAGKTAVYCPEKHREKVAEELTAALSK